MHLCSPPVPVVTKILLPKHPAIIMAGSEVEKLCTTIHASSSAHLVSNNLDVHTFRQQACKIYRTKACAAKLTIAVAAAHSPAALNVSEHHAGGNARRLVHAGAGPPSAKLVVWPDALPALGGLLTEHNPGFSDLRNRRKWQRRII